jgi:hypothetical protein
MTEPPIPPAPTVTTRAEFAEKVKALVHEASAEPEPEPIPEPDEVEEAQSPAEEPEEVLGQVEETATSGQVAEPEASPAPEPGEEPEEPTWPVEHKIGQYTLEEWDGMANLGDSHGGKGTIAMVLYCAACQEGDTYDGYEIDCEPNAIAEDAYYTPRMPIFALGWTLTDDGRLLCPDHWEEDDE